MIQRALGIIAGVDRKTLESCPASDKLWAAHLGASLCLSFIVVLGVSYHATGYMIDNISTRLLVSGVIALTVLMFDRALCQSDWFYQGTLWDTAAIQSSVEAKQTAWRFVRVGIRLAMSFGLAWVIAMFLELAIFSGTINEKIEADRVAVNQPIFDKIATYEAGLNAEAKRRQAGIDELEALHRAALTEQPAPEATTQTRTEDIEQQIRALVAREAGIQAEIAEIDKTIQRYTADMNAEEFGLKAAPNNSGRPGAGPRYEFAKKQREAFQAQRAAREAEIVQLHARRDDLRAAQAKITTDALAAREQERAAIKAKADALQGRIDAARANLKQFEIEKVASVAEFRRKAVAESYYQDKREKIDPLTRIAAYQELKNDPKDGATMTLFSWMTRFFIIFLEIVPVVAKIFFSPPSVYAAKIQAQVERARQRIENNEDLDDDKPVEPAAAPAAAAITLPAMSLEPVAMAAKQSQPIPPKAESPKQEAPPPELPRYEDARYEPQRPAVRDRAEERHEYGRRDYAARDLPPRGYDRNADDRMRYGARTDYAGYDDDHRGYDRRDFDRRYDRRDDYDRDYDRARPEPARRRAAQFVARDYATRDFRVRGHDEPEFDASEIDVRNLIMPRRGAPRREAFGQEPLVRVRFPVRDDIAPQPEQNTASAAVAERSLRWPDDLPVDDFHTRELVRQVLADAETAARAEPARETATPAAVAVAPAALATAPVPAEPPIAAIEPAQPPAAAIAQAEQQTVSVALAEPKADHNELAEPKAAAVQPAVLDESAEPEVLPAFLAVGRNSSAPVEAAPPASPTPLAHPAEAVAGAQPADIIGPLQKYSADVEKLMTEAMEMSRARKKHAHPRREPHHDGEDELPLDHTTQYEIFPKQ